MNEEKPISPLDPFKSNEVAEDCLNTINQLQQNLAEKTLRLEEAADNADRIQYQYDRQSYYLKIFFGINRELSGLRDMETLMENFLRLALDSLGIEEGGVFLFNNKEKQALIKYRLFGKETQGCSAEELEGIKTKLDEIGTGQSRLSTEALSLTQGQLSALKIPSVYPQMAFWFTLSEAYLGLVFLGRKLNALAYTTEEEEFLKNLANNLAILLERAKAVKKIQALQVNMEQKNSFLQKTVVDLNISENRLKVLEKAKPQFRQAIKKELERSRQVSALDFFMIIGLGLALGIIFNLVNPNGINPIPAYWFQKAPAQIDAGRAKLRLESGEAFLVDARPEFLYRQRHIKGAVNLPLSVFDFVYLMKFSHLDPEKELIVYGRNISRQYDQEVALQLTARGHGQVKILSGGLKSWQERGFPVEP